MLVENVEDVFADLGQFSLNLLSILLDHRHLRFIALAFLLLLDGRDDSPRCSSGSNDVLVGH